MNTAPCVLHVMLNEIKSYYGFFSGDSIHKILYRSEKQLHIVIQIHLDKHQRIMFEGHYIITKMTFSLYLIIVISLSAYSTHTRNDVWFDEITLWNDVIKKAPLKARGHNNIGFVYSIEKDQPAYAIKEFLLALRTDNKYIEAYNNLAVIYYKKGRQEEAVNILLNAIELNLQFPDVYNNLGAIYYKQGRTEEAIKIFLTALQLKPEFTETHYNLGLAFYKTGRVDEAISEYKEVLRLQPDHRQARENLQAINGSMGWGPK